MSDLDIIRRIEAAVIARHGYGNSISVTVRPSDGHRRKRDALVRLAVVCGASADGGAP